MRAIWIQRPESEPEALLELGIDDIIALSLANAVQRSSFQGNDHAVVDGLTLETIAKFWVSLIRADLQGADLRGARLHEADLEGANLEWADLNEANLSEANLERANLSGAKVTGEQLAQAKSLKGATLPNAAKYEGHD